MSNTDTNPEGLVEEDNKEIAEVVEHMGHLVYLVNFHNGWYEDERTFGEDVALIHSEVSEALEAYRDHGMERWVTTSEGERIVLRSEDDTYGYMKPEGVGSELADVLIRLLDAAHRYNVDLGKEFLAKLQYNEGRGFRHGGKRL